VRNLPPTGLFRVKKYSEIPNVQPLPHTVISRPQVVTEKQFEQMAVSPSSLNASGKKHEFAKFKPLHNTD
jgi:hypothetical protein